MSRRSAYESLSFEDALRIIYYEFSGNPREFKSQVENLLANSEEPHACIAPAWYREYKQHIEDNKKEK